MRCAAVAMTVETGSRADSVGAMRAAACFGLTTTTLGAAPAGTTTVGATDDEPVDGVSGVDAVGAASAPRAVRALSLEVAVEVAGAPQAATPRTTRTAPTPATALARVHGMSPLSPPPSTTVPVQDNRSACTGRKHADRRRRTRTNGYAFAQTGVRTPSGCALLPHERSLRASRPRAYLARRHSRRTGRLAASARRLCGDRGLAGSRRLARSRRRVPGRSGAAVDTIRRCRMAEERASDDSRQRAREQDGGRPVAARLRSDGA